MSILLNGRGILGGVALLFGPGVAMVVPAFLTIFYLLSTGLRSRVSYGIAAASVVAIHLAVLKFGGSEFWVLLFVGPLDDWDREVAPFLLAPRLTTLFVAVAPVLKNLSRWWRRRRQKSGG